MADGRKVRSFCLLSRERFIFPYKEQSSYSTVDFVKRAIAYFGYAPEIIQTDNGPEFTHTSKTDRVHPLDVLCIQLHITHKLIRPKTPWHNGKVERSHRNDQERFYNYLKFYSYDDLLLQMKRYLRRSNRIAMSVLGWKSPIQKRQELEAARVSGRATPSLRQSTRNPVLTTHLFFGLTSLTNVHLTSSAFFCSRVVYFKTVLC